jgi:methionyl-tRNA synthetase
LLAHYEAHPEFIGPETRANEVKSFVRGGLQDLSVSRTTFDWGVPVPGDPKHIMYVWVDALTNYITGVGFPDETSVSFQKYWPADVHIIGKDIIRFHAVYWPAFLMSAGVALPRQVVGHGFLDNRGEKMSKSVGTVVDPFVLASDFGVDQIRYFLLREVPFGQDGNYSRDGITQRINADLANDLGNLAQRSLSMIAKNCGGVVPEPGALTDADETILAAADGVLPRVEEAIDAFAIHKALEIVWALIADANRYFAGEEPWAHKKTDPERMGTILYVTAEVTRQIAILVQAVMPESGAKLLDQLAVPRDARDFAALGPKGRLKPGTALPAPSAVFPRYIEPDSEAAAS